MTAKIKTRFLIVSDTHGIKFNQDTKPLHRADVAIHCGDLTTESKLAEYHTSIQLMKDLDASLKLVIGGNHDFTLDTPVFRQKVAEARPSLDPALVQKKYGDYGEARTLFDQAKEAGILFLDEGTHHFILDNGASLTVYASPFTPSVGDWGFQYHPEQGHDFYINNTADVVITHGPPRGILDYTISGQRAGCPHLFGAVARSRPRLHCFGHIHESWGAKIVSWRKRMSENPSHFTDIDHGKSPLVENLAGLDARRKSFPRERCYLTSHCDGDPSPVVAGEQTLFVNAAVRDVAYCPVQLPWLVDIELESSGL